MANVDELNRIAADLKRYFENLDPHVPSCSLVPTLERLVTNTAKNSTELTGLGLSNRQIVSTTVPGFLVS
jgi:hypothetical protein